MQILPARAVVGVGVPFPFGASGGTEPYTFRIASGTGSIDASTGLYIAPSKLPDVDDPQIIVIATDADGIEKKANVTVTTPLGLFADIIQTEMSLQNGRVYFWDQKINMPTDFGVFVAIAELSCKPFGNTNTFDGDTNEEVQSVNILSRLQVDIISRGPEARDRKEEVIMALKSMYAQRQQSLNSFKIARLPSDFKNLSSVDGAAIPYRYSIDVAIQYMKTKRKDASYYDTFDDPTILVEA